MAADYDAIIVGAGVVGVFTAWALQERGLKICLIDRESGPAQQTSAANAGVIAPGYVAPFASPGAARKAFFNLFQEDRAFSWAPSASASQWHWLLRWLSQGKQARYERNRASMFVLATYSQACLHEVANRLGLRYRSVAAYHVVFRTKEDFERSQSLRQQLKNAGLVHQVLSRDELFVLEPSLRDASLPIEAALQVQGDEAGDCRAFVIKLWDQLIAGGTHWLGSTAVTSVSAKSSSLSECVLADGRKLSARHLILAAGPWSLTLLKELKPRLPIYPIRGFSLTWDDASIPQSILPRLRQLATALMDDRYKIAITPLHSYNTSSLRAAGMALLGPPAASDRIAIARQREAAMTLWRIASQWFNGLPQASFDQANGHARDLPRFWIGSRPMLPDGLPVIGSLGEHGSQSSLWINSGHGSTGWAMAAGSAYLLADLILGASRSSESLAVSRLSSHAIRSESLAARANQLGARPSSYPMDTMDFSPWRWCRGVQH
jgi:D-amino-acid dehydrogenase